MEDKQNFSYLGCVAKISVQIGNVAAAVPALEQMVSLKNTWIDGYVDIGHAFYKQADYENALINYMKALRIGNLSGQEVTDQLLYQRAGHCYINLEKWEDAKVMFLMCAEDYKTAFSHFFLGIACYNLGAYEEAERVISLVNYLDPSNSEAWAYLALVLLKRDNPPLNAAYQTMNESFKLGVTNASLMLEVATAWYDLGCMQHVLETLQSLLRSKMTMTTMPDKLRMMKQIGARLQEVTASD